MDPFEYSLHEFRRSNRQANLDIQDLLSLADVALDTNDREWLKEISVKIDFQKDIINRKGNKG